MNAATVRAGLRAHRGFAIVLALALVVHFLAWVAFHPGLFFPDSYPYLGLGWASNGFPDLRFDRPSGYPIMLWLLEPLTGKSVAPVALIQQLMVIAVGVLVYAALVRMNVRRWLATLVAALVLFDSYLLVLADNLLADVPAMLLVAVGVYLVLRTPLPTTRARAVAAAAAGGLALGLSVPVHVASLFILPVAFLYVVWARRDWRVVLAVLIGMAVPVLGYMTWHKHDAQTFGFTRTEGWFLFARIAKIGTCGDAPIPKSARILCPQMYNPAPTVGQNIWGGTLSPARRAYNAGPQQEDINVNRNLRHFAIVIILDRPWTYTRMIGRDVLRYFTPGEKDPDGGDVSVTASVQPLPQDPIRRGTLRAWAPGYDDEPDLPRAAVNAYGNLHTPRPLLGVLTLLAAVILAIGIVLPKRLKLPHRREAFLLLGGALALVIGATATSAFVFRYLVTCLPFLWAGMALVASDLLDLRAERRASRA
jgi:Dolichyl-phosphate-mannose-protein mannosyltransferase